MEHFVVLKKKMSPNIFAFSFILSICLLSCSNDSRSNSVNSCTLELQTIKSEMSTDTNGKILYFSSDLSPSCMNILHNNTTPVELSLNIQPKENGKSREVVLLSIETPSFKNRNHSYESSKHALDLSKGDIMTNFTSTYADNSWHPPWQDKALSLQVTFSSPANFPDSLYPSVAMTISQKG